MRQVTRVNEYYDLFDIKTILTTTTSEPSTGIFANLTNVPTTIKDTHQYNPFRGFWNNNEYNTQQKAYDNTPITGKIKSPQAANSLRIDDNGDIWCYPPNVSVPYWSRIIFRNYDYDFLTHPSNAIGEVVELKGKKPFEYSIPAAEEGGEPTNVKGTIYDYSHVPLFLRFDEYPSRSKVIFSECDKTRNPDIDFRFAYHKGQMEPIKLNLSLSANTPIRDPLTPGNTYNYNLRKQDIENLLQTCYWCIEWIYEPDTH